MPSSRLAAKMIPVIGRLAHPLAAGKYLALSCYELDIAIVSECCRLVFVPNAKEKEI